MNSTLKIEPNRYADWSPKDIFTSAKPKLREGYAEFEVTLREEEELLVLLAAPQGALTPDVVQLAVQVMKHLTAFDLIVQQGCASHCEKSGLASYKYESELAHMTIDRDRITFCYYGAAVNTEWNEVFCLSNGHWIHEKAGLVAGSGAIVETDS